MPRISTGAPTTPVLTDTIPLARVADITARKAALADVAALTIAQIPAAPTLAALVAASADTTPIATDMVPLARVGDTTGRRSTFSALAAFVHSLLPAAIAAATDTTPVLTDAIFIARVADTTERKATLAGVAALTIAQIPAIATFTDTTPPLATDMLPLARMGDGAARKISVGNLRGGVFNVKDYGAVGNGLVYDSAAIQATIDATTEGGVVVVPRGTYELGAPITISKGITLIGSNNLDRGTVFNLSLTTQDGFVITTDKPVVMRDFTIQSRSTCTAGASISVDGTTHGATANSGSLFHNIAFINPWNGINVLASEGMRTHGCQFNGIRFNGIQIDNVVNSDQGIAEIAACVFHKDSAAPGFTRGVHQISSGGMTFHNNYLGVFDAAYQLELATGAATSNLIIADNNFDDSPTNAIILVQGPPGTQTWAHFAITGNTINCYNTVGVQVGNGSGNLGEYFQDFVISGNVFSIGNSGIGVYVDGGLGGIIAANQFYGQLGGERAVLFGASYAQWTLGINGMSHISFPYTIPLPGVRGHITSTATWDPPSVADGAMTSTTIACVGAEVGDAANVGFSNAVPAGAILSASVTAQSVVTVTLFNKTGAPLDLSSGTLRVAVLGY